MIRRLVARLADRGWWRLARLLALFTGPPTNRAHLLLNPSPGDDCEHYVPHDDLTVAADCTSDGHYLCGGCKRRIVEPEE